ncbi:hypothetical protein [Oceanivirga miroungae]|uniref:Uncharacterized protein n=1 Tax=Oceanivirga miroungae TaxID=1130046 RepID=A0A6I8M8C3_9FUSO|nr:hypothetical protein [Oceanivirga miroungae]VWL85711.1 hypothetical protein OMES3154_00999 [Oceanivirga miroungae]
MIKIKIKKISSENDRLENTYVLLSIIFIFIISFFTIFITTESTSELINKNHISAKSLSGKNNITYNYLKLITDDIDLIDMDKLSIKYLKDELFYEPFAEGSIDNHKWIELSNNKYILFVGSKDSSTFILKINKLNKNSEILFSSTYKESNLEIDKLLRSKEFKVIDAYTGKEFRKGN